MKKSMAERLHILLYVTAALLSLCAVSAVLMPSAPAVLEDYQQKTNLIRILWELKKSYSAVGAFPLAFCFVGFFKLTLWIIENRREKCVVLIDIFSFALAAVILCGKSFQIDNTLDAISSSSGQVVKSILVFFGFYWVLSCMGYVYAKAVVEALSMTQTPPSLLRDSIIAWYRLCYSLPFIGLLSSPALYIWLLFFSIAICLHTKKRAWLIPIVPLMMCFFIIVLSPGIQGSPRYAYPIIYAMPLLLAWLRELMRKKPNRVLKKIQGRDSNT